MTAKTTPENTDLVGQMRKNNRAARAECPLLAFFDIRDATGGLEDSGRQNDEKMSC